jgi:signal transduction histidine kinase
MLPTIRRYPLVRYGAALLLCAGLLLLYPGMLQNFFRVYGYAPHGHCYLWQPELVTMYVLSDTLIGVSYTVISFVLAYFVYRARRDLPFNWVFLAFGGFIIACGSTHFMDVVNVWIPSYWIGGYLRMVTALASVTTAVLLPPLLPKVFSLVDTARLSIERKTQLETLNSDLSRELELRKEAEAVLQASRDKLAEMDRIRTKFIADVSHELRTPVTTLALYVHLLRTGKPESRETYIQRIDREAHRLKMLVQDVLDMSRLDANIGTKTLVEVDLNALVTQAVEDQTAYAEERGLRLSAEYGSDLPMIMGNPSQLTQVLNNLLINAIHYTPGGEIRIHTQLDTGGVLVQISDTGIGIPPDDMPHIFERFYRGKNVSQSTMPGTGIGLAIVREIVTAHGGTINVNSELERGTTFSVWIPVKQRVVGDTP